MIIAVIGATGTIGSSIVQLLEEKGHNLLRVSRNEEHKMNIEDQESIFNFFSESGPLDAIICATGNASFGKLSALTNEQVQLGVKSKLLGQVNLCRAGLQVLKPNGTIILTGGILAHQPWPETSNISMANAGVEGFVKALALELSEGRRILVVHPPLVKETAGMMGMDDTGLPSALMVAQVYLDGLENDQNGVALYL